MYREFGLSQVHEKTLYVAREQEEPGEGKGGNGSFILKCLGLWVLGMSSSSATYLYWRDKIG